MFWLGFDKILSNFVRNLEEEVHQCLGMSTFEYLGALALNNFQKVQ
jgi:hypothetical protein